MSGAVVCPGIVQSCEPEQISSNSAGWSGEATYKIGPVVVVPGNGTTIEDQTVNVVNSAMAFNVATLCIPRVIEADPGTCRPRLFRTNLEVTEGTPKSPNDKKCFVATVNYEAACGPTDEQLTFTSGSATTTITRFLRHIVTCDNQGNDVGNIFDSLINVNHNGEVGGCEIVVPAPSFTLRKCFPAGYLDDCSVVEPLIAVYGHTNAEQWRCFKPHEAKFMGFDITSTVLDPACALPEARSGQDFLTCRFDISPETQIEFGGKTLTKRGWDKVWTYDVMTCLLYTSPSPRDRG